MPGRAPTRSNTPPSETAQASRARQRPRCSPPGASGAAIRRSTYSAKKNGADELEAGIERRRVGVAPRRHGVGQHDRDAGRHHHMMREAKDPGGGAGALGPQEEIKPPLVHAPSILEATGAPPGNGAIVARTGAVLYRAAWRIPAIGARRGGSFQAIRRALFAFAHDVAMAALRSRSRSICGSATTSWPTSRG